MLEAQVRENHRKVRKEIAGICGLLGGDARVQGVAQGGHRRPAVPQVGAAGAAEGARSRRCGPCSSARADGGQHQGR
eukprot:6199666-Pleurochrysis_carterae.AAC.3